MKNKRREGPKGGVYNRDRTSEAKRLRVTVDARTTEQECEREELGKDEQIPMTRFRLGDDISVVDSSHGTHKVNTAVPYDSKIWPIKEYCNLLLKAQVSAPKGSELLRIIYMPHDPDILFWIYKAKHNYAKPSFSEVNKQHSFEEVRQYIRKQAKRQIYYFSHLLKAGVYTVDQLREKTEKYITVETAVNVFVPVMKAGGMRLIGQKEMQDMKKDDYNKFIIDHCACIDAKAAESDARGTGGPDIDMFCQTIASLKNTISLNSPFHLGGVISLPTVRYEKVYHTLAVTAATRKEDQETTSKIYDADTLSKRDDFLKALLCTNSHEARVNHLLMQYSKNQLICTLSAFFYQMKERISRGQCNAIKKEEAADILAKLLIVPSSVALGSLAAADFMSAGTISRVKELKSKHSLHFASARLGPRKSAKSFTSRSYWKYKARVSLRTQQEKDTLKDEVFKKQVEELSSSLRHIFEEQKRRCNMCKVELTTRNTRAWTNGSVDRVVPGARGGLYVRDNVQIVCGACNVVKYWYALHSAKVLLGRLGKISFSHDNGYLLLTPLLKMQDIEKTEMNRLVLPWCRLKLRQTYVVRRKHGKHWRYKNKKSDLTLSGIVDLVKSRWIGKGYVQDTSGLQAPLHLLGLDRIDPDGGYRVGNIRLLLTGLNFLKNNSANDKQVIQYLLHLKSSDFVHQEALKFSSEGHELPLHHTTNKILDSQGSLRQMISIERAHIRQQRALNVNALELFLADEYDDKIQFVAKDPDNSSDAGEGEEEIGSALEHLSSDQNNTSESGESGDEEDWQAE